MKSRKILVTGSAGFIGFHLAKKLLERRSMESTCLDTTALIDKFSYRWDTLLKEVVYRFIKWYKDSYGYQ